jgi:hypothetical protein
VPQSTIKVSPTFKTGVEQQDRRVNCNPAGMYLKAELDSKTSCASDNWLIATPQDVELGSSKMLDSWRRHFQPYNKSSHSILNDRGGGVENSYRAFVLFITPHSKLTEVVSVTLFPTPYNVSLIIPPSSFTAGRLRCVRPGESIEGSWSSSFLSNYRGSGEPLLFSML